MATQTSKQGIDYVTIMKRERAPLKLRLMRSFIKVYNFIAPIKASEYVLNLFLTPKKVKLGEEEKLIYSGTETKFVQIAEHRIFVSEFNTPQVLLVHGWGSSSYRFRTLMKELENREIGFVAFDFPAHGQSSGKINNAKLSAEVISGLLQQYPTISSIVAHSFGGIVTNLALEEKNPVTRLVTVGSPTQFSSIVEPFYALLHPPASLRERFENYLSDILNRPLHLFDVKDLHFEHTQRLVVHDINDSVINVVDSRRLEGSDENLEFLFTQGLGHRKLLHTPKIVEEIVNFVE
jgi:pimeloyl-ACP methyl ester carboxylesterase